VKNPKTKFYASKEVADAHPEFSSGVVKEGDVLTFDDIKIEVVKAVHGRIPFLREEKEITENI
jgi:hypothetical protein